MSTPEKPAVQTSIAAKLNIRPELNVRPLMYVSEVCPPKLTAARGQDSVARWGSGWQLISQMENAADGASLNIITCKATGLKSTCRSYSIESVENGDILRIMRMVELNLRCQEHPGFSQIWAIIEDEEGINIFFEAEKMDIYSYYAEGKRSDSLTEEYAATKIILPLLQTIEYMHAEQAVIHRCISTKSVVINDAGVVKLSDFTLALCLNDQHPSSIVGRLPYLAPELLVQMLEQQKTGAKTLAANAYDERIDIWAVGVVVYELMIGRFPFSGNDPKEMLQSIGRYTIFADPKCRKFSKDTFDFLKNLLAEDVSERPSAAEMIDHPFIQKHLDDKQKTTLKKAATAAAAFLKNPISFRTSPAPSTSKGKSSNSGGKTGPRMSLVDDADSANVVKAKVAKKVRVKSPIADSLGMDPRMPSSVVPSMRPKSAMKAPRFETGSNNGAAGPAAGVMTPTRSGPSAVSAAPKGILKNKDAGPIEMPGKREKSVVMIAGPEPSGPSRAAKSGVSASARSSGGAGVEKSGLSQVQRSGPSASVKVQTIKPPSAKEKRRLQGGLCGCFGGGSNTKYEV